MPEVETIHMGLTIPTIHQTEDPDWSEMINTNLSIIDAHDHIDTGVPIRVAALNIDEDLSLAGFNLTNPRSVIFQNLTNHPSTGIDTTSVYVQNGNLYYNNSSGAHIQITSGNGLNTSTSVSNVYESRTVSSNLTILNTDTFTYLMVNTSATRTIFLPAANTVSPSRFYYIKDITGLSETNSITLTPNGSDTIEGNAASYTLKKDGGSWLIASDGVSAWYISHFSNADLNNGQIIANGHDLLLDGYDLTIQTLGTFGVQAHGIFGIEANEFLLGSNKIDMDSLGAASLSAKTDLTLSGGDDIILAAVDSITILAASSNAIISGNSAISSTTGNISLTALIGDIDLEGNDVHITGRLRTTGPRRIDYTEGADEDTSYSVNSGPLIYVVDGSLSANRVYTLSATDAFDGDIINIAKTDNNGFTLTIKDNEGTEIAEADGSTRAYMQFIFNGTTWELLNRSTYTPD